MVSSSIGRIAEFGKFLFPFQNLFFFSLYYDKKSFYFSAHVHLTPWLLGTIFGFAKQEFKIKLSKSNTRFCWIASWISIIALELFYRSFKTTLLFAIFHTFKRIFWGSHIAWVIFACHHLESGGVYKRFLSHSFWEPIARLGLGIYLTHYVYIFMTFVNIKQIQNQGFFWLIHITLGDIVIATIFGTLTFLIIESPILAVVNFFEKKDSRSSF